jgi:hypothetical protein
MPPWCGRRRPWHTHARSDCRIDSALRRACSMQSSSSPLPRWRSSPWRSKRCSSEELKYFVPEWSRQLSASVASAMVLIAWPTSWRWPALVVGAFTFALGTSLVHEDWHLPDVIGGWCLAVACACLLRAVFIAVAPRRFTERRKRERAWISASPTNKPAPQTYASFRAPPAFASHLASVRQLLTERVRRQLAPCGRARRLGGRTAAAAVASAVGAIWRGGRNQARS